MKMHSFRKLIYSTALLGFSLFTFSQTGAIRINQVGYYPDAPKFGTVVYTDATTFEVFNTEDNSIEYSGTLSPKVYWYDSGDSVSLLDFSDLVKPGIYRSVFPVLESLTPLKFQIRY